MGSAAGDAVMITPIVLFAYNRPDHLRRTLACLAADRVPLVYAFSDGPRTPAAAAGVAEVREILRSIDFCETVITERPENLGLGRSIVSGVSAVFEKFRQAIVFEDDLVCVPGAYHYLSDALEHYRDDTRVMSLTGWTHPTVTPAGVGDQPYFDGRAECLVWASWARAWQGMDRTALDILRECRTRGIDIFRYGADLPSMAESEQRQNIWAVRWLYLHILRGGLSLRPPWSMVDHIGFDSQATNASDGALWSQVPLRSCPPAPDRWPEPREDPECPRLWQRVYGSRPPWLRERLRGLRKRLRPGKV
jgi:hypothetical protein